MVEPQLVFSSSRSATPTEASFRQPVDHSELRVPFQFGSWCRGCSDLYAIGNIGFSGLSGSTGTDSPFHSSMPGDAASRTTPVREWPRPDLRRRQSNPASTARPPGFRPPTNATSQGYFPSHPLAQVPEAQHRTGHSFPTPGLHYPSTSSYPQGGGYYGQYTVPNQPPLNVAQTPPYAYPHGYHPPGGVESTLGRHEMQPTFQPAPPHHPPYSYQQHSRDGPSGSGRGLSNALSSRFASHPPPTHSPASPPYMGSGHFPTMAYPSPMGTPQYAYPPHFSATPTMYRPYGPMAYPQHAASAPPEEAQGTWYFLSHGTPAPPQQYHYDGGQYQHPYTAQYPPHAEPASFQTSSTSPVFHSPTISTGHTAPHNAPPTSVPSSAPIHVVDPSSRSPASGPSPTSSVPLSRREWHPKPPPHRSPWVMWVGNVPTDASQDELWEFFSTDPGDDALSHEVSPFGAVVSIFLIARSNCAFINYSSEPSLEAAIKTFHGKRLRPNDPQCPMLVCKVRRSADDLKSGVGGQRGTGMHKQWVKEQRRLQKDQLGGLTDASQSDGASVSSQSVLDHGADPASMDPNQTKTHRTGKQSSSSESFTSTSSSLLGEHFPTRYFILKSLSERDLEIGVQSGLWATQKHNELVLDRAYRTSKDVFLIFSVNKSGEFYGYARMAGPIRQGEGRVSWSSRSQTSPPPVSPSAHLTSLADRRLLSEGPVFMSPETLQRAGEPPPAMASGCPPVLLQAQERDARRMSTQQHRLDHHAESAPAKLGGSDDSVQRSPSLKFSLDHHQRRQQTMAAQAGFHLDPEAPFRAMKDPIAGIEGLADDYGSDAEEHPHEAKGTEEIPAKPSPSWGDCFKVEWLELRKVPFHKTRHLRNAWNKGREIKVSRDGTELESGVGKRFLEEWANLVES